jgi:hypothetical protein
VQRSRKVWQSWEEPLAPDNLSKSPSSNCSTPQNFRIDCCYLEDCVVHTELKELYPEMQKRFGLESLLHL